MTYEDDNPDNEFDYITSFNSWECTCKHEPDEHGWMGCDIEGCECDAKWEE